jgi:hypothetical protein
VLRRAMHVMVPATMLGSRPGLVGAMLLDAGAAIGHWASAETGGVTGPSHRASGRPFMSERPSRLSVMPDSSLLGSSVFGGSGS